MLISVQSLPEKNLLRRKSCRMSAVKAFLDSGYEVAEFAPEAGDTIRRAIRYKKLRKFQNRRIENSPQNKGQGQRHLVE